MRAMKGEEVSTWRRNSSGGPGQEAEKAPEEAPTTYRFIAGRTLRHAAPAPAAQAPAPPAPAPQAPAARAENERAEAPEEVPAFYRFTLGRPMRRFGT